LEPQNSLLPKSAQSANIVKTESYSGEMGEVIRVRTPNGTEQLIQLPPGQTLDGTTLYVDESGNVEASGRQDLRDIEFNFLDSKNICCGLCGEVVPYDLLLSTHIPQHHPEMLEEGTMTVEDVPYETWLKEKLNEERRRMESGMRGTFDASSVNRPYSTRNYRNVSQVRVNTHEMTLNQLTTALRKKMLEKLGRSVPVTLVDKQHARCGLCNAVVSLNRKFEVVHLVRHFNAWHPSVHQCAGKWKLKVCVIFPCIHFFFHSTLFGHFFFIIFSRHLPPENR
uniref:C2H2-type domain-containing protein n=1 Tax=Gongylonema pulchrum TaxID=637853 RepID=A0A183EI34_9BILA